jgi:hypothetical protein
MAVLHKADIAAIVTFVIAIISLIVTVARG